MKDVESKQRRGARFAKNKYSTTPGTVNKILRNLRKEVASLNLKGDRALGNSILRNSFKSVPKQTKTNTVLSHIKSETGTLPQKEKAVSGGFQNGCHVPSLRLLTPELYYYFFIINFTYLTLTP